MPDLRQRRSQGLPRHRGGGGARVQMPSLRAIAKVKESGAVEYEPEEEELLQAHVVQVAPTAAKPASVVPGAPAA